MSLSAVNTLEEVEAAYIDNASYAETGDVLKCRAFITACRILIIKIPKATGSREATVTLNPELVQKEKDAAEEWLNSNGGAVVTTPALSSNGSSVRVSFRNCRD